MTEEIKPMLPVKNSQSLEKAIDILLNKKNDAGKLTEIVEVAKQPASVTPAPQNKPRNLEYAWKVLGYTIGGTAVGGFLLLVGYGITDSFKSGYIVKRAPAIKTIYDKSQDGLLDYFKYEDVKRNGQMWNDYKARVISLNPGVDFSKEGKTVVYLPDLDRDGKVGK